MKFLGLSTAQQQGKGECKKTTVPKAVRNALGGLEAGDKLEWAQDNGAIIVRKQGAKNGD